MIDDWRRGEAGFYLERGEALEQIGRLDEAMSEFKRAIRADPGLAEAHMALGFHYRRKNLLSKAAEEFRSAASLARSYDSYFNLGHVLVDLGLYGEAISVFQQCLDVAPGDPALGYEIAYAHYSAGDHAAAMEYLQPLLAERPDDWELYYLDGSCKLAAGQYSDAEGSFERAMELLPPGESDEDLQEALQVALRYQEYASREPWDIKARLYAEYGVVSLGSLSDDGLCFPVQPRQRLTNQDLARTLQRLHALRLRWRWHFDAVVSVDPQSEPLALALAHSLKVPLVQPHEAPETGLSLLVWAAVTVPELLTVVAERVSGSFVSFVAAATEADLARVMLDVIGLVTTERAGLPWDGTPDHPAMSTVAREIVATVKAMPPDEHLVEQVRYYAREHRRLRFFPQLARPSSS